MEKLKKLIKDSSKEIIKKLGKNLVSLYLIGTAATKEKPKDIDFFAIIKNPNKDEKEINRSFEKKYPIEIRVRTIAYDELIGKVHRKTLITKIKIFTMPILARILNKGKLIYGEKINLKKLIKKQSPKEVINFTIRKLKGTLKKMNSKKKTSFPKKDFPKFVAYLTRAELEQKGKGFVLSYEEMARKLKNNQKHIIHDIVAIRKGKKGITKNFLKKVEDYIKQIESLN
tara:strand:+ start:313 stop:996 length:684 start_codon:yes stop_codon:yes gene_type:complete